MYFDFFFFNKYIFLVYYLKIYRKFILGGFFFILIVFYLVRVFFFLAKQKYMTYNCLIFIIFVLNKTVFFNISEICT